MRILVVGEKYSPNLGDPLICEIVENQISQLCPKAVIDTFDLSGRATPENIIFDKKLVKKGLNSSFKKKISMRLTKIGIDTEYIRFQKAYKKKVKEKIRLSLNQDYDLVIFAGGQMFKDTFVIPIAAIVEFFKGKNTPIYFNACGVGPIHSKKMRNILKEALTSENVIGVSSRDDVDTINREYLHPNYESIKTFDPALWTSEFYKKSDSTNNVIGLGVMFTDNIEYRKLVDFWKRIISELERCSYEWKMFTNGPVKDYVFAVEILEEMGYSAESISERIVLPSSSTEELIEVITGFKALISFRLHSHIIAYSFGKPSIAIVWDEKVKHFFENIKLEDRYKDISTSSEEIMTKLTEILDREIDSSILNEQKKYNLNILREYMKATEYLLK